MKLDADSNLKYGFIDTTGATVVPLEYDNACNFTSGLAAGLAVVVVGAAAAVFVRKKK